MVTVKPGPLAIPAICPLFLSGCDPGSGATSSPVSFPNAYSWQEFRVLTSELSLRVQQAPGAQDSGVTQHWGKCSEDKRSLCRRSELKGFGLVPHFTDGETEAHRGGRTSPGHLSGQAEPGLKPFLDSLSSALLGPLCSVGHWDKWQSLSSQRQNEKAQTTSGSIP